MPALDAVGIRTKELHYLSRLGQKVWSELRGADAGFDFPSSRSIAAGCRR